MVLQVLLSQVHRLRALVLLKKFLDLGPWAVNLALSVGIFPYVLKLLQSPASELRQVLVFIWAKILALDSSCQVDLSAYSAANSMMPAEQKVMAAFIISVICNKYLPGQKSCLPQYLHKICINLLQDPDEDVRKWICLCLAKLWEHFDDAKRIVIEDKVPRILGTKLRDDRQNFGTAAGLPGWISTGSTESVLALANVILHNYHQPRFESVAKHFKNQPVSAPATSPADHGSSRAELDFQGSNDARNSLESVNDSISKAELLDEIGEGAKYYAQIWHVLKEMQSRDPFPQVVDAVKAIVSFVNASILEAEQDQLRENSQTGSVLASPPRSANPESLTTMRTERSPGAVSQLRREGTVSGLAHIQAPQKEEHTPMQPAPPVPKGLRSAVSVGNFQQYQNKFQQGSGNLLGAGDGHVAPLPPPTSSTQQWSVGEGGMGGYPVHVGPPMERYGRHEDFPPTLLSTCYERHKAQFNDPILEPVQEDEDPLSEKGAERWERYRRYNRIRGAAMKLAPGFSSPRSSGTQKTGLGLRDASLHNPSSYSPIEYDAARRMSTLGDQEEVKDFTMNLRQRAVLNNDAEMTSLLLFHPYETMLLVADEKDQISLYNFEETETKVLTFGNKNPPG
ncbi:Armadillo-type fold [Phytophthora cactorum]|nr:Armadillo-type fold [Phytophthora cactorum]